jgi:hypothetical protein
MGYYIDFEKVTIDEYRLKLESAYLPPSRMMLKDKLDERFGFFKTIGIKNVKELTLLLKKKEKLAELSESEIFSGEYLSVLLRELNSLIPKPNMIADFSDIPAETVNKLIKAGIKNTKEIYDHVLTETDRKMLSESSGADESDILKLTKLADLSRIKWVGVTFAQMLYAIGLDTVGKVADANPEDVYTRIRNMNNEKQIFKGQIGMNDMRILVHEAKQLPLDIEY